MIRLLMRLWPGAERFQREDRLDGLAQAVTFSLLLNVSFFSIFIWPDAFSPVSRTVVCLAVVVFWVTSMVWPTRRGAIPVAADETEQIQATYLFQAAQREYLIGNWVQAARLLQQLLQVHPHDIPARLRLALIYRRVGRCGDSAKQLEIVRETAGAGPWQWEIRRQQQRLAAIAKKSAA